EFQKPALPRTEIGVVQRIPRKRQPPKQRVDANRGSGDHRGLQPPPAITRHVVLQRRRAHVPLAVASASPALRGNRVRKSSGFHCGPATRCAILPVGSINTVVRVCVIRGPFWKARTPSWLSRSLIAPSGPVSRLKLLVSNPRASANSRSTPGVS